VTRSRANSTALRRFSGAVADELAILCRPEVRPEGQPESRSLDPSQQAEAAYRALADCLDVHRASFRDLASETLLLRDIRRELPLVLDARERILADLGQGTSAPAPAFIQQAPIGSDATLALSASAVIPHHRHRDAGSTRDVRATPSCPCEGCARCGARLLRLGDQVSLHSTNVYGTGTDAFEQALDMFRAAEQLLAQSGMDFHDVVRTWIHLRDIDRDYDALNRARREFFGRCGIELKPASTGVGGMPFPDEHDFSITLHAIKTPRPLDPTPMSTPTLNEAWSYGADFSRGLRFADANKVMLYVSGTASIDESGRTVHVDDFEAQVDRMLQNIESLLAQQGARVENLVSGITYLKHPSDAAVLRSRFRERGFGSFPCAIVHADLCRPELLCETEAVAMLPLSSGGA
jgi:enamine deaminase RidA (YjgF/YER057c/UK114 family)